MNCKQRILVGALAACISTAVSTSVTAGDVFKWVDENGITHYGERPPTNRDHTRVIKGSRLPAPEESATPAATAGATATAGGSAPAAASPAPEAAGAASTSASAIDQQEAALNAQVKAHNCKKAKEILETLNSTAKVRAKNDQGEYVILSDEEMQQRKAHAQKVMEESC